MRHSLLSLGLGKFEHGHARDPELFVVPVPHPRLHEHPAGDPAFAFPEHQLFLHVVHVEKVTFLVFWQRLEVVPLANLLGFIDVRRPTGAFIDADALHVHLGVPDKVVQAAEVAIVHDNLNLVVVVQLDFAGRGSKVENLVELGVE